MKSIEELRLEADRIQHEIKKIESGAYFKPNAKGYFTTILGTVELRASDAQDKIIQNGWFFDRENHASSVEAGNKVNRLLAQFVYNLQPNYKPRLYEKQQHCYLVYNHARREFGINSSSWVQISGVIYFPREIQEQVLCFAENNLKHFYTGEV